MKNFLLTITVVACFFQGKTQTAFWTENFGTNPVCQTYTATAYSSSNGAWSVTNTGNNDTYPNIWFVSAKEAGMGVGNCGDGCLNNPTLINMTMHVGSSLTGDLGAAYAAGNGFFDTDKRLETPVINCSNATAITMTLSYIMNGVTGLDYCEFYYYNGSAWSSLGIPAQTPTTSACSGQAAWAGYTITLPASANNNANVKLGFRWQNTDNTGADPSVAIDDIALIGTVSTPSVVLTPSFTIPNGTICVNNTIALTANTGTTTATGYTWAATPAGANFSAPNASSTNVSFTNANTYSITLTAAAGTLVSSVTHTILVNPLPTVVAAATKSAICSGETNTLNATGTAISYTWQPGNLSGNSVTVSPASATIYTVNGTSAAGCIGTNTISFLVNQTPVISISANSASMCLGSVETLTAGGATTYTWKPDNTNGNTLAITPTVNTTYTLTGTSVAGCIGSNTISITVVTCSNVGLDGKYESEINFEIYPNPIKDKITIKSSSIHRGTMAVELIDAVGKLISTSSLLIENGVAVKEIDMSLMPQGVYFIKLISNGKQISVQKIIKE